MKYRRNGGNTAAGFCAAQVEKQFFSSPAQGRGQNEGIAAHRTNRYQPYG